MRYVSAILILAHFSPAVLQLFTVGDYLIRKDYYAQILCVNQEKPEMNCNGFCQIKLFINQEEREEQKPGLPASILEILEVNAILDEYYSVPLIPPPYSLKDLHYSDEMPTSNFIDQIFVPPEVITHYC